MGGHMNSIFFLALILVGSDALRLLGSQDGDAAQTATSVLLSSPLIMPPALQLVAQGAAVPVASIAPLVGPVLPANPAGIVAQQPVASMAATANMQPVVQQPSAAQAAATAATAAADAASAAAGAAAAAANAQRAALAASVAAPASAISAGVVKAVDVPISTSAPATAAQGASVLAGLTFTMVVKSLCVAGNVIVQVSPLPQAKRWQARGCTGEADAAPYVAIAFGGCQWCFYGMFAFLVTSRSGFLVLVQSNILGAVLGTYYVVTFYRNCRTESSFGSLQKYLSAVASLVVLQFCSLSVLPPLRALFVTGLISSFCSFMGATSVLVTVPTVIRTKNGSSIPGPYAAANMASAAIWTLCGYILEDPMVMMPNIFATICSAASLGLKMMYPSVTSSTDDDHLASVELEPGADAKLMSWQQWPLEKEKPTELSSLHTYINKPSPFSKMQPDDDLNEEEDYQQYTFPEGLEYFKGTGQKLQSALVAAAPQGKKLVFTALGLPPRWGGDGTGGTY